MRSPGSAHVPGTLARLAARLGARLVRARRAVLLVVAGLVFVASGLALGVRFDMSFRPLFAPDEELIAATERLEATFGQSSGAFIGVVLERERGLDRAFLEQMGALSDAVGKLPHVVEVVAVTAPLAPEWERELVPKPRVLDAEDPVDRVRALAHTQPDRMRPILSDDERATVLWARLDLPLEDLAGRAPVVRAFQALVQERLPEGATARFVGISVVEEGYARLLLEGLFFSVGLTCAALALLLFVLYGSVRAVVVVMAGTAAASPLTLAVMRLLGEAMTLVNGMVLVVVLVVGVADAIHTLDAFFDERRRGAPAPALAAFARMLRPCLLTTLTTCAGFLSLLAAQLPAIRSFGLLVAIGVALAFVLNQALLPALLTWIPPADDKGLQAQVDTLVSRLARAVTKRPLIALALTSAVVAGLLALAPRLETDQRFNEDVPADHPLREAQAVLEERFGGVLGPEVMVRRVDGAPLVNAHDLARLSRFVAAVRAREGVTHVQSVLDALERERLPEDLWPMTVDQLRAHPELSWWVGSVISPDQTEAAVLVRVRDLGTRRSLALVSVVEEEARRTLGPAYRVEVAGQWRLAQEGMASLLADMRSSFLASCLFVLPLLLVAVGRGRLFLLGALANVAPVLAALGVMVALGVTLRVGTAMILAVALGIAVDDTLHLLCRLVEEERRGGPRRQIARRALSSTGRALFMTTAVLVVGFVSMTASELLALRDMGLVAAATLLVALLVDVVGLPALYVLLSRRRAA